MALRPAIARVKLPTMTMTEQRRHLLAWASIGVALIALTIAFTLFSHRFGYDYTVQEMPVSWLVGGLMLAGIIYLPVLWLLQKVEIFGQATAHALLWFVIGAGLLMRLVLFASEPALEDDYQRYLWDGAVTAQGLNPYKIMPAEALKAAPESEVGRLAAQSGNVLERVNHPDLRTLYPPVAQGAFALSHWVAPFSLTAWRGVILIFDLAALGLLLVLLRDLGRSPLWAALYWWNPVALKELFNSAHMEALLIPLVLGALVLAIRGRALTASAGLVLAAGAKMWPALLLPLIWRPLLNRPRIAMSAVILAALAGLAFAAPLVLAGLDDSSGLAAYAQRWKTNSALFPLLEGAAGWLAGETHAGLLARAAILAALATLALWLAATPCADAEDLTTRAVLLTAAVFLLSPAQFPWYFLWVLPLLALRPVGGLLLLTATLPIYYSAFYFLARGTYPEVKGMLVWLVWTPALIVLAWEFLGTVRKTDSPEHAENMEQAS